MVLTTTIINANFRIVFEPCQELFGLKELVEMFDLPRASLRFAIGAGELSRYIGEDNAHRAFLTAWNSSGDKFTRKFRKFGRVDFYVK